MKEHKISALVITKNEEENIQDLIENLNFVDEIVVVDSFSTDRTEEICNKYSQVRFYKHKFENYSSQRNIAINYALNPWLLFLDADERIPKKLEYEILQAVKTSSADAFELKRRFYFKQTPLYFGGLQNDKHIRLFKKNIGVFKKLVHEKLDYKGSVQTLKNHLNHYSYIDYTIFKNKLSYYGKLKGKEAFEKGNKYSIIKHYSHSSFTFFHRFIIRLGFLDGTKGLVISYLMSFSVWERYNTLKLIKKQNTK